MALAGNGRWCYLDPKLGAMHAVAEAARKVACTGATPVAATNCLNFGNPEKPEIMAQFSATVDGIAEACTTLGTPITGGNVSFYNETRGEGIYPTPVVGVVGILEDVSKASSSQFHEGQVLFVIGAAIPGDHQQVLRSFGSSEYARAVLSEVWGAPPLLDLAQEAKLHTLLAQLAQEYLGVRVADICDGGLAVALARGCIGSSVGAMLDLPVPAEYANPLAIFSEGASHIVLSVAPEDSARVEAATKAAGCFVAAKGTITGSSLCIAFSGKPVIHASIAELKAEWTSTLESQLAAEVVTA
jgi:phosphoribosylformylglycinamidine synthase